MANNLEVRKRGITTGPTTGVIEEYLTITAARASRDAVFCMYPTSNNPEILVGQCTTVTTLKEITTSSWFLSPPKQREPQRLSAQQPIQWQTTLGFSGGLGS